MIIYFTGTGNSRYLAKLLAGQLGDECVDSAEYLRKHEPGSFTSEKPYVFVFPTYAYRMPKVFETFLKTSKFSGNKQAYFIMTCGADNGGAGMYIDKLCGEKDLDYRGTLSVVMPDNYVVMYTVTPEEKEAEIIQAGTAAVMSVVDRIKEGVRFEEKSVSFVDKLKSGVVSDLFSGMMMKTKKFYATDDCISCGLCERSCPLANITLKDGKPVWGDRCTHCVACISACPKKAIEYGSKTKGRRRYYLSEKAGEKYIEQFGEANTK